MILIKLVIVVVVAAAITLIGYVCGVHVEGPLWGRIVYGVAMPFSGILLWEYLWKYSKIH